jgi:hypothetical protein
LVVPSFLAGKKPTRGVGMDVVEVVEACQDCGCEEGWELHTCPFSEEIRGDTETLCNCCADCERHCAWEI